MSDGFVSSTVFAPSAPPPPDSLRMADRIEHYSGLPLAFRHDYPLIAVRDAQPYPVTKRVLDVGLSAIGLLLLSPFFAFIALAIKLTSAGPVFFCQSREGLDGRRFKLYKFRTMHDTLCDPDGLQQTQPHDARLTPIGRALRRKSLDELPQLFNVLKGEMSLVGPRPHVANIQAGGTHYETLVSYYALRHTIMPGLSGWAQVNGYRGPTDDAAAALARINHDLAYAANHSLLLDLKIIWLTIWRELIWGNAV